MKSKIAIVLQSRLQPRILKLLEAPDLSVALAGAQLFSLGLD
jgi:hypothetical protein